MSTLDFILKKLTHPLPCKSNYLKLIPVVLSVPEMTLKEKAEAAVRKFWETWASREGDVVSQCLELINDDFLGYGTEQHEVWRSSEDIRKQLLSELAFASGPATITIKSMETMVAGTVAVCLADLNYQVTIDQKTLEIDPLRLIMTLQETQHGIKFISMASISFDSNLPDQVPWPGLSEPKKYDEVSILFTDFVGFSNTVATMPPKTLVYELNDIFSTFDDIVRSHHLEKVKTIGDAYMAVSGIKPDQSQHALNAVKAGLDMIHFLEQRNQEAAVKWEIRVGVHSGPVVAGIIGKRGLTFDVWGDTVNLANQMEQKGEPGKINLSAFSYELVKGQYKGHYRGKIQVKSRGYIDMYFISRNLK